MKFGKLAGCVALVCAVSLFSYVSAQEPAAQQEEGAPAAPAAGGRGGRGGRGGPAQGRGPNFPQQTRKLANPDVIAHGKALFVVNCTACHGADLRGGAMGGPNLLRSQLALSDQHGELIAPIVRGARQDKGMPAFTSLGDDDVIAIAEYIHSVLAEIGRQGRPPGTEDLPVLNILKYGDPVAGKAYFDSKCASCHSVTGDLAGIGAKYPADGHDLQNAWVSGGGGGGRGGRGAASDTAGKPTTVVVTMSNGDKVEGTLLQGNEFEVTLVEQDGTRRTIDRDARVASVTVHEPDEAHKKLVMTLEDKDMHNVTAYLASIK
ncbi:MAG TPA: c-type cytochrome [Candidatus Acidoferrales bacterium]|nr:c-type cytochrome [Candidatus Acidoferrales bacterium]